MNSAPFNKDGCIAWIASNKTSASTALAVTSLIPLADFVKFMEGEKEE